MLFRSKFSLGASVLLAVFFGLGSQAVPQLFTADAPVLDQIGGPWWVFVSIIVIGGAVFALDGVLLVPRTCHSCATPALRRLSSASFHWSG